LASQAGEFEVKNRVCIMLDKIITLGCIYFGQMLPKYL